MTDFAAESIGSSAGSVLTERSGTAVATNTVPAGARILARNTGAGVHTIVLPIGALYDGQAVTARTITMAAGAIWGFTIPPGYGDASGRVGLYVGEGTQAEVKYYVVAV